MNEPQRPVLCVMGPTAAGKTELALHLAGRLPADIVSVDSALVYRGLDIGTAKPDAATLARHPHRLVDIVEPNDAYSTARFRDDALREIADIHAHCRIPLLVGGTMLYFRALTHGLSDLPPADPEVRARIEARARRDGWATLHDELATIDPDAATRIHPNDPQRIQRALEVFELTGKPISELQNRDRRSQFGPHGVGGSHGLQFHKLAIAPEDRGVLHERIEARVKAMFAAGLVNEVRRLRARGDLDPDLPSMRAVGYRQVWAGLDAGDDEAVMAREVVFATRQLAKRQLTWLRHETGLAWLDPARNGWLDEGLAWAACAKIPVPETLGKKEYGDG